MKKLLLFLVALTAFACNNDDDNDNNGPHPIVGTWNISAIYNTDETPVPLTACTATQKFVFKEDKTLQYNSAFEVEEECFTNQENGTYEVSGNTLNVTVDGFTGNFAILELNDTTLRVQLTGADADIMEFTRQ